MNTESEHESDDDTRQELSVIAGAAQRATAVESLSHNDSTSGLLSDQHADRDESDHDALDNELLRRRVR